MEESLMKFLSLQESSSATDDLSKLITNNESFVGDNDLSYINFIKFKFNNKKAHKDSSNSDLTAFGESSNIQEEWLCNFLLSNQITKGKGKDDVIFASKLPTVDNNHIDYDSNRSNSPETNAEVQAEELIMSSSTYAWRFEDKQLSKKTVQVDNFFPDTENGVDAEARATGTSLFGFKETPVKSPVVSSYLPSGMVLDDEDEDEEIEGEYSSSMSIDNDKSKNVGDALMEDLDDSDNESHSAKNKPPLLSQLLSSSTVDPAELAALLAFEQDMLRAEPATLLSQELEEERGLSHYIVRTNNNDDNRINDEENAVEIIETIDDGGEEEEENHDDNNAESGKIEDDAFLTAMISLLRSTGSKNASLANALQAHQLAVRYGVDLSATEDITNSDNLSSVNDDNEVYAFDT